jgi:hypothetical protein
LFSLFRIEVIQLLNDIEPSGSAFKAWGHPITKTKMKLTQYLIKHYIVRTYEGAVVELRTLFLSALNGSE